MTVYKLLLFFFFSSRRRHTRFDCDWSSDVCSSDLHALARSAFGFGVARAALGVGESGNFPAAIKTTAEWFPKKERAFATGIFNAGSNVGAIVAPLTVPWIAINWGWQWAFILTGAIGLLWLAFWIPLYAKPEAHPRLSKAELAHIQ